MGQSMPVSESEVLPQEGSKRSRFSLGSIVLILGIIAVAAVFGLALARQNTTQPTSGPAPDFLFTTFDGKSFKLSDLKGKVVMINFWASWCIPCRDEAPELQATWEHYQNRDDVVFMGIAYADNGPKSLDFLREFGITYLSGPDLGTRISEYYHIQGVPETFIIDKRGYVTKFLYAGVTQKQLTTVIDGTLAEE